MIYNIKSILPLLSIGFVSRRFSVLFLAVCGSCPQYNPSISTKYTAGKYLQQNIS